MDDEFFIKEAIRLSEQAAAHESNFDAISIADVPVSFRQAKGNELTLNMQLLIMFRQCQDY